MGRAAGLGGGARASLCRDPDHGQSRGLGARRGRGARRYRRHRRAELAADARHDAVTRDLRVVARTEATPALPWITAITRDPAPIRAALGAALAALSPDDRDTLGISGLMEIDPGAYLALPIPAPPACESA